MKKQKTRTLRELSNELHLEIDDVLVMLWDQGYDLLYEPDAELRGELLKVIKKILKMPTKSQFLKFSYWQKHLELNDQEFANLLTNLSIERNRNVSRLPKGAINKFKKYKHDLPHKINDKLIGNIVSNRQPPLKVKEMKWEIIGHEKEFSKLGSEVILRIHYELVKDFASKTDPIIPSGLRDNNLIESAVHRQYTSIKEKNKYPTLEMCAAALFHSLIHNHPFFNGNKRTALVSLLVFMDTNNFMLTCSEDELFKFVLQVAQHRIPTNNGSVTADSEVLSITRWIYHNSRMIERGERPLKFRNLIKKLKNYNCKISQLQNGKINITRNVKKKGVFKIGINEHAFQLTSLSDGKEVQKETIRNIREELKLNEENGVDSAAFYDDEPCTVDEFIIKYRKILDRLSKL